MMKRDDHARVGRGDALVIIDFQNDFLPGGALSVEGANEIIPVLNSYLALFTARLLPIFATRDWHPANHCSFTGYCGSWPPHCIASTGGAAFAADLALPADAVIISKATDREKDAYSGFEGTKLADLLREAAVTRLFVGGLATDYCVLNTVRDGVKEGFQVVVLRDAIRAVNVRPGDGERAEAEMEALGVVLTDYGTITAP